VHEYGVKPHDLDTWTPSRRWPSGHNGVFGGRWCAWFHAFPDSWIT